LAEVQQRFTEIEQAIRVAETRRESLGKVLAALQQRRERLDAEAASLGTMLTEQIELVAEQLEQEMADLAGRETSFGSLREAVQSLQYRQRAANDTVELARRALAETEE